MSTNNSIMCFWFLAEKNCSRIEYCCHKTENTSDSLDWGGEILGYAEHGCNFKEKTMWRYVTWLYFLMALLSMISSNGHATCQMNESLSVFSKIIQQGRRGCPCVLMVRYVGLMWSLSSIRHLYLSGVWEGL